MTILVEIENSSGTKLGVLSSVLSWRNVDRLDRAGTVLFELPVIDPKCELIRNKKIAKCYRVIGGLRTLLGAGVIDSRSIAIKRGQKNGVVLQIQGNNLLTELSTKTVGFLKLTDGTGGGVSDALSQIMAFSPSGWSLDTVNGYSSTASDVYAAYAGESVLKSLIKITEKTGEHFRLGEERKLVWLRNDTPSSGIRAIQGGEPEALARNSDIAIIEDLSEEESSYDLVTRIYPFGAGNGDARLTLAATTRSAPAGYTFNRANNYIEKDSAVAEFGVIELPISFKDIGPVSNSDADMISAANTLFDATIETLEQSSEEQKTYNLKLLKLDKIVHPGETIDVVYREYRDGYKAIDINETLYVLETTTEISGKGSRIVSMLVSTIDKWITSDAEIISQSIAESRVFEAHPQLSANSYVTSYSAMMDSGHGANVRFWLGSEVTVLNQVIFRFRVDPLRSSVKSVGGSSTTTDSGGGSTQTTGGSAHGHPIYLSGVISGNPVYFTPDVLGVSGGGTAYTGDESPAHTHSVPIPNHNHTLTPNVSMVYGVFEESSGNTLNESDLVYKVNGGDDLAAYVYDLGDGWYQLDLTDALINSQLRPSQEKNTLAITTATVGKTAQITGQLIVRNFIQAIANL